MYKFTAIKKLSQMLDNAGIPHQLEGYQGGFVLGYPSFDPEQTVCTVAQHMRSYGGTYELLEMKGLLTNRERKLDEVMGYMPPLDVYQRIKAHWDRREEAKNESAKD